MYILDLILVGFVAGIIARLVLPGPKNPSGFLLTTVLGIAGAFLATWIGRIMGWFDPDKGAGLIGAVIGALIVLSIWHLLVSARANSDPSAGPRQDARHRNRVTLLVRNVGLQPALIARTSAARSSTGIVGSSPAFLTGRPRRRSMIACHSLISSTVPFSVTELTLA